MKIKELEIENILSIEKAQISFDETGLISVEGWNHDSQRSNGAGKSSIFNAISFALYGKVPRKITASEILRRGASKGCVSIVVEVGASTYQVKRYRPNNVEYYKDGVLLNISQEEFEKDIKMSYEQFIVSAYSPQGGGNRFISLNDTDKKAFLLKLLDLDRFSDLKKSVDLKVKAITAEISALTTKIVSAESKISAYSESLVDKEQLIKDNDILTQEIKALKSKLSSFKETIKPDLSKYLSLEQQLASKEKEIVVARTTRSMLHTQYKRANAGIGEFSVSSTCRECGSQLDTSEAKSQHSRHQEELRAQLAELKASIDAQDAIISKESQLASLKTKLYDSKNKELEQYNNAQASVSDIESIINRKVSTLENNNSKLLYDNELLNKIKVLEDGVTICKADSSSKSNDLQFYTALSSIYSPTGAPAYVLDSVIDSFNETIVKYVELVWPSASYSLNSYKETSKGDVVAKFSESLIMDGKDVSIGSLSGGELRALSLCVDFAVIEILQKNFGLEINPIILDEPFDGLDSAGKEIVIELLSKLANDRCIIVVDHSSEAKAMFSKVIMVDKRSGISEVSIQA